MRATRWAVSVSVLALGFLSAAEPTLAQQITGTPGSPEATTTITGKQLPPPDPKFGGVIKERASARLARLPSFRSGLLWGSLVGQARRSSAC